MEGQLDANTHIEVILLVVAITYYRWAAEEVVSKIFPRKGSLFSWEQSFLIYVLYEVNKSILVKETPIMSLKLFNARDSLRSEMRR